MTSMGCGHDGVSDGLNNEFLYEWMERHGDGLNNEFLYEYDGYINGFSNGLWNILKYNYEII
jgi:hypothetical protein